MLTKEEITQWFKVLQDNICSALETADGKGKFKEDRWERDGGGGGRTRILEHGSVIEKGGVNFSAVHGPAPKEVLRSLHLEKGDFYASGVSIVLHPYNPMMPIIHMNIRYFETIPADGSVGKWWFGGGIDLTPHYVDEEDARYFHHQLKNACDAHNGGFYQKFKKWADDYFYIKHRQETRGVGGIFFDKLGAEQNKSKSELFKFVQDIGLLFTPVYSHLLSKNKELPFGEKEKQWQMIRRGRYVEFNLVWDRGTKFGLDTGGRTESILMSLPPQANWSYNLQPEHGSREEKTTEFLKKEVNWV